MFHEIEKNKNIVLKNSNFTRKLRVRMKVSHSLCVARGAEKASLAADHRRCMTESNMAARTRRERLPDPSRSGLGCCQHLLIFSKGPRTSSCKGVIVWNLRRPNAFSQILEFLSMVSARVSGLGLAGVCHCPLGLELIRHACFWFINFEVRRLLVIE